MSSQNSRKLVKISAGEVVFSDAPADIRSVAGSCIVVCVYDTRHKVGGACHYALEHDKPEGSERPDEYFAPGAFKRLLKYFKSYGSQPRDLMVKVVGGAKLTGQEKENIGKLNAIAAKRICEKFGLKVAATSVGGTVGKKVRFLTDTGELFVMANAVNEVADSVAQKVSPKVDPAPLNRAAKIKEKKQLKLPIRVMIVDDSIVIQKIFEKVFGGDERFEVVGVAPDPYAAEDLLKTRKIDLMTLDLHMPKMDGLTYLGNLMKSPKFPVIVVSGIGNENGEAALKATELGAVDFVAKPSGSQMAGFSEVLLEKSIAAAHVNLKKVGIHAPSAGHSGRSGNIVTGMDQNLPILIGSSTGGTVALTELLTQLPANIPPIAIVQHIPPHFSSLFAKRLNQLCAFEVKEAENGDVLKPGLCLIAPGDTQMAIKKDFKVDINDDEPVNRHKPSVDYMFNTAAPLVKDNAIGIILTGMGKDGAKGLLKLREQGCHTIGQSQESCVVYGMPKEAFEIGACDDVLDLDKIPAELVNLLQGKGLKKKSKKAKLKAS